MMIRFNEEVSWWWTFAKIKADLRFGIVASVSSRSFVSFIFTCFYTVNFSTDFFLVWFAVMNREVTCQIFIYF